MNTETGIALQPNPPLGSYTWTFPGSPIRIYLSLNFVKLLLPELMHKVPIGGILIGRVQSPFEIEITDLWPVPGTGADPYAISLNGDELERLKAFIGSQTDGLTAVGYYRTHLQGRLSLTEEDVALLQEHFSAPTDVCLLIKPPDDGPATAGFFFWENGVIESVFSFNEFPFDVERLRLDAQEQRKAAAAQKLTQMGPSLEPEEKPSSSAAASDPKIPPKDARGNWLMLLAACLLIILGGGSYGYYRQGLEPAVAQSATANATDSGLALKARMQGWDLHVTWNRNAPIFRDGDAHGVLTILDGHSPKREVRLGREELQSLSNVMYFPMSDQVQFQLEVIGSTGKMTESILAVLGSAPSHTAATPRK